MRIGGRAANLAGEHSIRSFALVDGLGTVTLRYFKVFGPYQNPALHYSGVPALFCRKMPPAEQRTMHASRSGLEGRPDYLVGVETGYMV